MRGHNISDIGRWHVLHSGLLPDEDALSAPGTTMSMIATQCPRLPTTCATAYPMPAAAPDTIADLLLSLPRTLSFPAGSSTIAATPGKLAEVP